MYEIQLVHFSNSDNLICIGMHTECQYLPPPKDVLEVLHSGIIDNLPTYLFTDRDIANKPTPKLLQVRIYTAMFL